jgi:hypothetical protein
LCDTGSVNAVRRFIPLLSFRKEEVMFHMDNKSFERSAVASLLK